MLPCSSVLVSGQTPGSWGWSAGGGGGKNLQEERVAHWSRGPQPGLTRSLGSLGQGRNGQLAQRPGLGSYQQCF